MVAKQVEKWQLIGLKAKSWGHHKHKEGAEDNLELNTLQQGFKSP